MAEDAIPYDAMRANVQDADVLLWKGRSLFSILIAWKTQSRYTHAGIAVWIRDRLMVAESRERKGCRLIPLSAAIRGADVSWFQLDDAQIGRLDRDAAADEAILHLGEPYGWRNILRLALAMLPFGLIKHLPGLRRIATHRYFSEEYERVGGRMFCSEYVARCYRVGGLDLVRERADARTTPADLAHSAALKRKGRLVA